MHTARQLDVSMIAVEIDGQVAGRDALLPGWHPYDRLGVVVHDPFGAVGASLLVQLAITAFYDERLSRRNSASQYPEIYLFHVGGRYGNHGYFDYWPPRKEVFVEDEAAAVLAAVNERAITRLAVPEGEPMAPRYDRWEQSAAEDRILSAFAYSAGGRVQCPDVTLTGKDPRTEENPTLTLHPDRAVARILPPAASATRSDPEDQAVLDQKRFTELLTSRIHEVDPDDLQKAVAHRERITEDGVVTETYQRIPVALALGRLAKA
jgi:hypothetical protein